MPNTPDDQPLGSDPCDIVNYLLVLKCSADVCGDEIEGVTAVAALLDMQPIFVDKSRGANIFQETQGHCFRAVYVAGTEITRQLENSKAHARDGMT